MTEQSANLELLLNQYLDGELEGESLAQVEAKLSADRALRNDMEARKLLRLQLRGAVARQAVPDSLTSRVLRDTVERRVPTRIPAAWHRLQLVGSLAMVVLIAVVSWQLLRQPYTLLSELPESVATVLQIGLGKHVSCVKERVGASMFALGTYSSEVPAESRRLLDAAEFALPADFRVIERHVCGTKDRRFGHLVMAKGDVYLSILVTDRKEKDPELPKSSYAAATIDGLQIYAVRHDGLDVGAFALPTQYAFVVSDAGERENLEYSRTVASALRSVP